MNWGKAILAGAVGGVVVNLYSGLMHGFIMSETYKKHALLSQNPSMIWLFVVSITIGIGGGLLFAKSRDSWGAGVKGGVTFGFWMGVVTFFAHFYNPLIFEGFPYFLSWCWGGITLIGWMVFGAVASLIYKESAAASS